MYTTPKTLLAVVATLMVLATPSNSAPANGSQRLADEHSSPTDVPDQRTARKVGRMRRAHHSANLLRLALAGHVVSLRRAAQHPLVALTHLSAEQPIVVLHASRSSQERIEPEMIARASVEGCWDRHLGHRFSVGDVWRRLHRGWLPLLCQCVANSKVHCTGNVQEALAGCTDFGVRRGRCPRANVGRAATGMADAQKPEEPTHRWCIDGAWAEGGILHWLKFDGDTRVVCSCRDTEFSCTSTAMQTYGGSTPGMDCAIPFVFNGQRYSACTTIGREDGRQWCATTHNYDLHRNFTFCKKETDFVPTRRGNVLGALCSFPFTFNGRQYNACTQDGREDGEHWCAATPNYDVDKLFGFCPTPEQCQDPDSKRVYLVGETWSPEVQERTYLCKCHSHGEWTCVVGKQQPPSPATNPLRVEVESGPRGSRSQTVHWVDLLAESTQTYTVRWKPENSEEGWQEADLKSFHDTHVIRNLVPSTAYDGELLAHRTDSHVDRLQFQFVTSSSPTAEAPSNGRVTQESDTEIAIHWTPPDAAVTAYEMTYLPSAGGEQLQLMLHPGASSAMLSQLRPGELYNVSLVALSGNEQSNPLTLQARTLGQPLNEEMFTFETTDSIISILWEPNPNIMIQVLIDDGLGIKSPLEVNETSGHLVFEDLQPGSTYIITITIILHGTQRSPPVIKHITTARLTTVKEMFLGKDPLYTSKETESREPDPWPPMALRFTEVEPDSFLVSWDPPVSGPPDHYRLRYAPRYTTVDPAELIIPGSVASIMLTGLYPGMDYEVSLHSETDGKRSQTIMGTQRSALDPPSKLSFANISTTSATVTWQPPRAAITGYHVRYGMVGKPSRTGGSIYNAEALEKAIPQHELVPGDRSSINLHDLEPDSTYEVRVFAVDGGEDSLPAVNVLHTHPAEPQPVQTVPQDVHITEITNQSVSVEWQSPPGPQPDGYYLQCQESTGEESPRQIHLPPEPTFYRLDGLKPGHEYKLYLAGYWGNVIGPEIVIFVATPELFPKFYIKTTATMIIIEWQPQLGLFIEVHVQNTTETGSDVMQARGDSGHLVLRSLVPGVTYTVTITIVLHGQPYSPPIIRGITTSSTCLPGIDDEAICPGTAAATGPTQPSALTHQRSTGIIQQQERQRKVPSLPHGHEYAAARGVVTRLTTVMPQAHHAEIPQPVEELAWDPHFDIETTETSIVISWKTLPGLLITVRVKVAEDENSGTEVSGASGRLVLGSLLPGVSYTIIIIITLHGQPRGQPITKCIATDSSMYVKVSSDKPESLLVVWYPPAAEVKHYLVSYTIPGEPSMPGREMIVPGDQLRVILPGLDKVAEYNVTVRAVYGMQEKGRMVTSNAVSASYFLGVDAPASLRMIDVSESSVRLRWDPPQAPVTSYSLQCKQVSLDGQQGAFATNSFERKLSRGQTDVTLDDLRPAQEYAVSVVAMGGEQRGEPATITFHTQIDAPRLLEVLESGESWIQVHWDPPLGLVTAYRLAYESPEQAMTWFHPNIHVVESPYEDKPQDLLNRNTSMKQAAGVQWTGRDLLPVTSSLGKEANVTGLMPGVEYTLRVFALHNQQTSVPATVRQTTAIPEPTDLAFPFVGSHTLTVTWRRPHDVRLQGFRVLLSPRERSGPTMERSQGPEVTSATLSGLLAGTEYEVIVYAITNSMASRPLCGLKKTLPSLPPPGRVRVQGIGPDAVTLAWHSRGTMLSGFLLTAAPSGSHGQPITRLFSPLLHSAKITGLLPGVTYRVGLCAVRGAARSVPTPVIITTGLPGTPEILAVEAIQTRKEEDSPLPVSNPASVGIRWNSVPSASRYLLSCLPQDGNSTLLQIILPRQVERASLPGLQTGTRYRVLVEALQGDARSTVLDQLVLLNNTVSDKQQEGQSPANCVDGTLGHTYLAGEQWNTTGTDGITLSCTCCSQGSGYMHCNSADWCYDNSVSYRPGQQWFQESEQGQSLLCTCLGHQRGEIHCEPDDTMCFDDGKQYAVGKSWKKIYDDTDCTCTCLGGMQGWHCECEQP
uniref:fibronectin-like isoform X2 n=1 Tax=Myxine glutinosa TaxID=7769 RepID=UPI00358F68F1